MVKNFTRSVGVIMFACVWHTAFIGWTAVCTPYICAFRRDGFTSGLAQAPVFMDDYRLSYGCIVGGSLGGGAFTLFTSIRKLGYEDTIVCCTQSGQ